MESNSVKRKLILALPLALLAAAIWFLGPTLYLAHHFPLQDPQKRAALILTLLLAWIVKFFFLDNITPTKTDNTSMAQMLHALRGRFLGATRFLKKTMIDKYGLSTPLNKLPWYLLIGPPGAGKTTLLAYSNIHYILSKQYKQDGQDKNIVASSVCDWWVTRDLVLVDVPGCYAFSPQKDALVDHNQTEDALESNTTSKPHTHLILWKSLLSLLTKYRQKNNIGAIVIALQLPELLKQSRQQQTQWFQEMKQRLVECWAKFGKCPVYFVVTKCDLMPGFCEFFNDIGSDELIQPWGIPLTGRKEHEKLIDVFTLRFNALIKRLNKQLIWRLHQERNPQSRPLIKDFPLQLEFLKEKLTHLIKVLMAVNPNLDIEGVYLTSATQENTTTTSATLFHHDVPSALQVISPSPFIARAYFIKQIISYLLPQPSRQLSQRCRQKSSLVSQLAYTLGFSLLFIGALTLGKDFQRGLTQVSTIQRYLAQYQGYLRQNNTQNPSLASITNALPLLNTLQNGTQSSNTHTSHLQQIQNYYSEKSQLTAINIYHKALQNIVLPPIRNEFEKYLQSADDKNPEQLYITLKAYLMLRQPDPTSAEFILHTLAQISPTFNKKTINVATMQHIQNALCAKQTNELDNRLVKQIRKTLNNLSTLDLAYILLKTSANNNTVSAINLGTNIGTPPALTSQGTETQIPYMFTAHAFADVIKSAIPLAAQDTINGNAYLGKKIIAPESNTTPQALVTALTQQLQKTYIANYIDIWESLVDNISLNQPKNVTETDAMIMNLISSHSPLLQLLQTIHTNVDLEPILTTSPKLSALNTLFNQTQSQQKESLYQIFVDLRELHVVLQQGRESGARDLPGGDTSDPRSSAALLKMTTFMKDQPDPVAHIQSMTEKYPEPIKNWLQTLVGYTRNYLHPVAKQTVATEKVVEKKVALSPYKKLPEEIKAAAKAHEQGYINKTADPLPHGEFVKVIPGKKQHPLIYVRKD